MKRPHLLFKLTAMASHLLLGGLLLAGMALGGCGDARKLAGATSETTNGDIKASVTLADGAPAARVKILVVDDSLWLSKVMDGQSVVLDSAVTDDSGRFALTLPVGKRCNLQIDVGGEGLFLRGLNALADTTKSAPRREFRLTPFGAFSGTVRAASGMPEALRLAGTTYATPVSGDGLYAFDGVSSGNFPVVAAVYHSEALRPAMARSVEVISGDTALNQDFQVEVDRILIDDFERGWTQTALGRLIGGGFWFTNSDVRSGGNSSSVVTMVSDTAAYIGSSVHVQHNLGKSLSYPFATLAFPLGPRGKSYDLEDLKAISFWAKGEGSIMVRFSSNAVFRLYADSVHFSHTQVLSPDWTLVTIPVDSLRVPDFAPAALKAWSWTQAAKEVTTIDFKASRPSTLPGDTVQLYLDEVHLEGIPLEAFTR